MGILRAPGLLLAFLAVSAWPGAGGAQVRAPELIEEDLPPPEAPRPRAPPAVPEPSAPERAVPPPRPAPPPVTVRALEPVRGRWEEIAEAWEAWRAALREQDLAGARGAERRLLDLVRELGIEDLFGLSAAEVRAADRAREARAPGEALLRAELAVALAPDLPGAHLARARARLAKDPAQLGPALADLGAGASAALREPRLVRALGVELAAAGLVAVLVTASAALLLLFLRRLRLAVHDARHMPLARHTTPAQAALVGLALVAAPAALRLGPAASLAALALAAAPWLSRAERALASAALCAVALLPFAAEGAARLTAFTGTLAEDVHLLERGDDGGRRAGRLAARAAELPPPALVALGRHLKRRGDLEGALRAYQAAGAERADAAVNAANVRFLQGDVEGAKAGYLAAADQARDDVTALAAAHYGLSKVFVRQSALDQAQEARRRAAAEDAALLARHGSDEDFRANRWLVDVPVSPAAVSALARDGAPAAVGAALRARLAGAVPPAAAPWALLAVAAGLWPAALAARRLRPSRACPRCGRAACARCDGGDAELCGQCLNAFARKGVVDPADRARKELQISRHARLARLAERALGLACAGAGHLWRGEPWRGAAALLAVGFLAALALQGPGMLPPPHAPPGLAAARAALAGGLAVLVWAIAARDLFRRGRSRG